MPAPHPALRATFSRGEKEKCRAVRETNSLFARKEANLPLSRRERVPRSGG